MRSVVAHLQVVDEYLVGVVVQHGLDRRRAERSSGLLDIHQEQRQPLGLLLHFLVRRGARDQQVHVGLLVARGPDLLAVDHVAARHLLREGLDLQGVGSGVRLGDAKGLQPQAAVGDPWQVVALLLLAAVVEDGRHGVHLRVAGGAVAAGAVDLLQDRAAIEQRQPGAAVLLRDQRRQPAGLAHRGDEFLGVFLGRFALLPVLRPEVLAKIGDGAADLARGV
jgi:hypothetical protein